jgi:uncharacterized protein (TIGR02246 family)
VDGDQTAATRLVIDRLYAAYAGGDVDDMVDLMAEDAVVTFLGHGTFRGKSEIRRYMTWASTQLPQLVFLVRHKIVDGQHAAVVWDETGTTKRGEPWESRGVDVYRVAGGKVAELTVYSDTAKLHRHLDPYPDSSPPGTA